MYISIFCLKSNGWTYTPTRKSTATNRQHPQMYAGWIPILQAGTQVRGHSLLDAEGLKGKQVALINIENITVKKW